MGEESTSMTEGRGLLTDREREAIQGDSSDSYKYKTRTYVRRRLDKLEADADLLAEHEPELYDRLLDAVDTNASHSVDVDDGAADEPKPDDGPEHDETRALVERVVDDVAASWDDDHRLEDRKAAATAALTHAVESGEHVGQSDAIERFHGEHPVDGQNAETWWKQNGRKVLTAVGTYSRGKRGYSVDEAALRAYLDGDS